MNKSYMLHLYIYVKLETRAVVYAYIYMESHNMYWPVCVMPGDYIILDNSQYNQQAGRTPKVDYHNHALLSIS